MQSQLHCLLDFSLLACIMMQPLGQMAVQHDGCGCLMQSLQAAARKDVEVVGMGIGLDRTFVPYCYQRWVTAGQASALPDALRALYEQEEGSSSQHQAQGRPWEELVPVGTNSTAENIMKNMETAYPELAQQLDQTRQLKLVAGGMPDAVELDLAFVLDCSGSMGPWIAAARKQIGVIAEKVVPMVQEKYPELGLSIRYGLVAFRDFEDIDHLVVHDFTSSAEQLTQWVSDVEHCGSEIHRHCLAVSVTITMTITMILTLPNLPSNASAHLKTHYACAACHTS